MAAGEVDDATGEARTRQGRPREWSIESRETLHDGFYRIERLRLRHDLHGGGRSGIVEREQFLRGNVVGVLPYDPASDSVLLVEQFRPGAIHQAPEPWLWEIVAGAIDEGETPEAAARREAREETGLELVRLEPISHYLTSPGAGPEEVHVFLGECDLAGAGGLHGLADEDEDILARVVSAERAIGMLDSREVRNGLSIIALQWFALRRANAARPTRDAERR